MNDSKPDKKERKGALRVEPEVLGGLAVREIDIDKARRLDRKRGPGEQVYISKEIKKVMVKFAGRKGRFLKSCIDEACVDFLRRNGVEIAWVDNDDEEDEA